MAAQDARTGETVFLSELATIERVIAFVAGRNHLTSADADDFASHVKLKILEDDYAVLRKFQGKSSLRTYLTVVIQRLHLDYRNGMWGKWRPSAEAKRLGSTAILLEQLVTRDGYAVEEACELAMTNHRVRHTRPELERLIGQLPMRVRRRFEGEEALSAAPSNAPAPDVLVAEQDRRTFAIGLAEALARVTARLPPQDRLILRMRFEDGRTVAGIATMLRLDQKKLYRRIERLLRDLRGSLEKEGIESAAVLEMLESPTVSIEWERPGPRETEQAGPSMDKGAHEWR